MLILHAVNIRGHRLTSPHFHDNAAKIVRDNDVVFRRCPMLLTVPDSAESQGESKMRRSRNPTSSTTSQSSSLATGSSGNSTSTNTVPSLLKELHGLVLQIQVMFRTLSQPALVFF